MAFIDILIWFFRMKMGENCVSLSNSVLFKAAVRQSKQGDHKSGSWARGSWLRGEREEQIGTLYLLSTSAFKPASFQRPL